MEPLQVGGEVYLVVVDLCAKKNTVKILESLNAAYPTSRNASAPRTLASRPSPLHP